MTYEDGNRAMRKKGVEELFRLVDDIYWVERSVYGDKKSGEKGLDWLSKRKFSRLYKEMCGGLQDEYLCMIIECQHQIANNCYEEILQYSKQGIWKKMRDYYGN